MVDIGAGSLQISIYEKKALATTQNIRLGMAKIVRCSLHFHGNILL